jgi:hypothetical protein
MPSDNKVQDFADYVVFSESCLLPAASELGLLIFMDVVA